MTFVADVSRATRCRFRSASTMLRRSSICRGTIAIPSIGCSRSATIEGATLVSSDKAMRAYDVPVLW